MTVGKYVPGEVETFCWIVCIYEMVTQELRGTVENGNDVDVKCEVSSRYEISFYNYLTDHMPNS